MPDIEFNLFPRMVAHKQGVGLTTEEKDVCISLFNESLGFGGDGSSYSGFAYRMKPDDGYLPFSLLTPKPPETCVESG